LQKWQDDNTEMIGENIQNYMQENRSDINAIVHEVAGSAVEDISNSLTRIDAHDTDISNLSTNLNNEVTRATGVEIDISGALADEVTRATGVEIDISGALAAEVTRATGVESDISGALAAEVTRATGVESDISGALAAEVTRATGVEIDISGALAAEVTRATGIEDKVLIDVSNIIYFLNNTYTAVNTLTNRMTYLYDAFHIEKDGITITFDSNDISLPAPKASVSLFNLEVGTYNLTILENPSNLLLGTPTLYVTESGQLILTASYLTGPDGPIANESAKYNYVEPLLYTNSLNNTLQFTGNNKLEWSNIVYSFAKTLDTSIF
jgi:Arc/MetJ family transcription regulator